MQSHCCTLQKCCFWLELYLEVLAGELIQHVAWGDSWSSSVLTHTVRTSVEWREEKQDARYRGRGREICHLVSQSARGPPAFPLPLMQRFQGNGLMGKTTTAWLILAPESLAEWIWKSENDPISAHIPVNDRVPTQKEREGGAKMEINIARDKVLWEENLKILFRFIAHLTYTHTQIQWTFLLLVSRGSWI